MRTKSKAAKPAHTAASTQPALECWSVGGGLCRIQANDPKHRQALHELKGFVRVGYSTTGSRSFCVVYQGPMTLQEAQAYTARRLTPV